MILGEVFSSSKKFINKLLWIILIPIILDLTQLFSYLHIYKTNYTPVRQFFTLKIGIISSPPSVSFLLGDFPSAMFQYNQKGFTGIIHEFTLFNVSFMVTLMLITSFIHSGYLSVLGMKDDSSISVLDFFRLGNKNWHKFFIFSCINSIPAVLMIFKQGFVILVILSMIFFYVESSIVIDGGRLIDNFKRGISFLFNNLGLTIKMAFYFGFIFSLLSILVYVIAGFSLIGVVIDIIIIAYFGTIVNRAVLEVYMKANEQVTSSSELGKIYDYKA